MFKYSFVFSQYVRLLKFGICSSPNTDNELITAREYFLCGHPDKVFVILECFVDFKV